MDLSDDDNTSTAARMHRASKAEYAAALTLRDRSNMWFIPSYMDLSHTNGLWATIQPVDILPKLKDPPQGVIVFEYSSVQVITTEEMLLAYNTMHSLARPAYWLISCKVVKAPMCYMTFEMGDNDSLIGIVSFMEEAWEQIHMGRMIDKLMHLKFRFCQGITAEQAVQLIDDQNLHDLPVEFSSKNLTKVFEPKTPSPPRSISSVTSSIGSLVSDNMGHSARSLTQAVTSFKKKRKSHKYLGT